jgi:hypothetical protein
MNEKTLEFHLNNIKKHNRFDGHISDVRSEISGLRLLALKHRGTSLAGIATKRANQMEQMLNKAIREGVKIK